MKVLITGGAGFIGSHLSEAYLERGDSVHVLDVLSTGSMSNIAHLKNRPRFAYTVESVTNVPLAAELVDEADVVIHLAAAVGVKLIVQSPVHTIETNIRGTEIILNLANKKKKPVLIASTSEVYGKAHTVPFKEDDDLVIGATTKGRWAYACSKAIDEFLALAYWKERKLPVVVIRLFNTVGPRQTGQYGMVLPSFIKQALANQPITVYGDGTQSRSFTWVGDVVGAMVKLMDTPAAYGEVLNIGNGKEITILELAKLVKNRTKSRSEIQFVPYDQAYESGFEDMPRRVPDISKIKKLIGYAPTLDIGEIIDRVVEQHRSTGST